jgi:hypothetical protein
MPLFVIVLLYGLYIRIELKRDGESEDAPIVDLFYRLSGRV